MNCIKCDEKCSECPETKVKPMKKIMKKIKTEGTQLFSVPHNEEGLAFLKLCKNYLNTKRFKFSKRGRGPRGSKWSKGYDSHTSLRASDSKWFAVYTFTKRTAREIEQQENTYKVARERDEKIRDLESEVAYWKSVAREQTIDTAQVKTKDVKVLIGNQLFELR